MQATSHAAPSRGSRFFGSARSALRRSGLAAARLSRSYALNVKDENVLIVNTKACLRLLRCSGNNCASSLSLITERIHSHSAMQARVWGSTAVLPAGRQAAAVGLRTGAGRPTLNHCAVAHNLNLLAGWRPRLPGPSPGQSAAEGRAPGHHPQRWRPGEGSSGSGWQRQLGAAAVEQGQPGAALRLAEVSLWYWTAVWCNSEREWQ